MHRQGSGSWRFEDDNAQYLNHALFVRDGAGLVVPSAADIPPRLAGNVPDYSDALPSGERAAAGHQWVVWWRRLLGQTVREARQSVTLPDGSDLQSIIRHRFAGRDDVFDPPAFGSLADMQPLQSAAVAMFEIAGRWSNSQPGSQASQPRFAWPLVRDVAESTAAELGNPVGDLSAVAHVLDVRGLWSYLAGPGCALCSAAVATDPSATRQLLRELFSSGPGHEAALAQ